MRSRGKRRQLRTLVLGAGLVCLIQLAPLLALCAAEEHRKVWDIELGLGVGFFPEFEGSKDYLVLPFPFARVERNNMSVELVGSRLTADVHPSPTWVAGPVLNYRFARRDVRNPVVDRLREVDAAVEIGGIVGFNIGNFSPRLTVLQDVAGGHGGMLLTLGASYEFPLTERLRLQLVGSGTYASHDYMQSYFGIDADNARRSGLPTFGASAGFKDVGVEPILLYSVSRHWRLGGEILYKRLLGDAADSPIVKQEGSANQFVGILGVSYRF